MMKIAIALFALVSLSSCNTFIGMGRDMRQLGEMMEHKAHGRDAAPEEPLPTY